MKKGRHVTLSATIKRGAVSDPYTASVIPADLKKALGEHAKKRIDDAAASKVMSKYLRANFLKDNLGEDLELFRGDPEVWATEVEAYGLTVAPKGKLPKVTAAARFALVAGPELPKDQDAMADWEDENTPLTDAVNFFWQFGDTQLLIGEHEGAGAGVDELE